MAGHLKDEFLGDQMDSNMSSPGSWTPVELVNVELMEEARRAMQSPSKLKMEPLLAEMAATAPMGSPKLETSAPIPFLDNTGKGTLDESSLGIVLMGWNNLLGNVGKLSEEMIGDVPKGDDESVSLRETISALQESNQDVTKEINKGRLCLGAQGS
eukprot:scaffold17564_cov59-Attheya_sp.AAC.3